ncbi:MAG: ABC transporter ATP-binding protein [Bacillota bacterium]|uniref:ABC transporter ATP-binding protein n=1 Tax=Virgibacillus salarius TaxID=447199 RepID=A0A941IAE4_9BACI|nr:MULTISPECIES: ABC transporter ATP-binding protein [Bacillaceae]NAZ07986.1 ATP-binding cassette domain-containing protein [Agaribacter marinus]MBR7795271.1 ABC transporter ATP-binding protein [Virgibacillus salarius]MCC2252071.1 ABC transporter ATP-binding protein [Virgibacillus sp. AGTR]MDY7045386.1 ABC transporter ATP-binding protein [Virgibacillus sp. M23]QRZ19986.1 ABC transporter ATP-binding protein [Virgibacillus sp. AGTR]
MQVLKADNLTKIYGSKRGRSYEALHHFHLTVNKGEFIGIMGPSGSGKTTLLNLLSTIDVPSSGKIIINEKNLTSFSQQKLAKFRRKEMGFIFQDYNLLETLTIGENILLPLTLNKMKVKEMEKRLVTVSKQLGIDTIIHKRIMEVSGGQMQRAAIARAIIHDPTIIFADEPTGNLDSKASLQVMESLRQLQQENQATTVMVTHDPFAASFCGRVIFIKDGRLFNEIHRGDNRQSFFQDILNVQSLLGGNTNDLQTIRF